MSVVPFLRQSLILTNHITCSPVCVHIRHLQQPPKPLDVCVRLRIRPRVRALTFVVVQGGEAVLGASVVRTPSAFACRGLDAGVMG